MLLSTNRIPWAILDYVIMITVWNNKQNSHLAHYHAQYVSLSNALGADFVHFYTCIGCYWVEWVRKRSHNVLSAPGYVLYICERMASYKYYSMNLNSTWNHTHELPIYSEVTDI